MADIKTLNGYTLADTKARQDIATLTAEKDTINALLDVQTIMISPNLNATKYKSGSQGGVYYTVNSDNSITFSGTATADSWPIPDATSRAAAGFWLEAGTYTMSTTNKKNVAAIYLCTYEDASAVTTYTSHWPNWETGLVTFTTSKRLFVVALPTFYKGAVLDGFMLRAKIEEGTVATEYVSPWASGDDGVKVSARLDRIEESIGLWNVPDYYLTERYLTNKVSRINEVGASVGGNGDVFMVITDQHWESNAKKSPALMRYLSLNCKIPRLFALGDIAFGLNTEYLSMLDSAYLGTVHHVAGNHEWDRGTTGNALAYYMDSGKENQIGNANRHYYYVDNRQQKIRYVIMSSETEGNGAGYEAEQIAWLTNTALNVEAGWSIIVFAHSIYNYNPTNDAFSMISHAQSFLTALDGYSGNGEIVAVFSGHTHRDAVMHTTGGIPIILTACDKYKPYIESGADKEPWLSATRTEGTITEQAFDVVAMDKTNKTLTLIRIGAPADNRVDNTSSGTVQERVVTY